ncbi:hypothetical protein ACIBI3_35130 [Actinomadura luteofluorescens]|uniref:hypothetical protein n=1 Tax=Actinomadura luteofluorescens TaxID=46163 RepID=UPI00347E59AD
MFRFDPGVAKTFAIAQAMLNNLNESCFVRTTAAEDLDVGAIVGSHCTCEERTCVGPPPFSRPAMSPAIGRSQRFKAGQASEDTAVRHACGGA